MHGINLKVIDAAREGLRAGKDLWLITIVSTWGASPRPAGSLCIFDPAANRSVGSLSGGCIEEDLFSELASRAPVPQPFLKRYGGSPEEQERLQLPCGGTLELLVESLQCGGEQQSDLLAHFERLYDSLSQSKRIVRCVDLSTGLVSISEAIGDAGKPGVSLEHEQLLHCLGPKNQLLLIGAGEVSGYLLELAKSLDFEITLCDPRENFLQRQRSELEGERVEQCMPDDLVFSRFQHRYCAVLALAHDPRVDDLALLAALEGDCFYVGAMGSERTSAKRRERLLSLGITEGQLARLHAPIGMNIGSKTPPEIAVSIAADLIRARRQRDG